MTRGFDTAYVECDFPHGLNTLKWFMIRAHFQSCSLLGPYNGMYLQEREIK
jgi:hypothetical protein